MAVRAGKNVLFGALFWIAALAAAGVALSRVDPATRARLDHVRTEGWRALHDRPPAFVVRFAGFGSGDRYVERNNGVFAQVDGRFDRIGEITRVRRDGDDLLATIAFDRARADVQLRQGTKAVRRSQGRSFVYALQKLLTDERRAAVAQRWQEFRALHEAAVLSELQPVVADLLQGGAALVEQELPAVLARHGAEVDALVKRLRIEVGRDQLLPLLTEEVWPVVVRHAAAPAEVIGRELWDKVPLFDIAMRAAADKVLEKEPVRVEKRWRDFVNDEALPTLAAHEPEMAAAFAAIARELLQSDAVHRRVSTLLDSVLKDPEAKRLTSELTRELLFENPRLKEFVRQRLDDPEVRARLQRVSDRLQEFLDPVGDLLLLDATGQAINPDLAQLIRLLLLKRDAQVLYLELGDGPPLLPGSEIEGRHDF
jgi:hypothetical protein